MKRKYFKLLLLSITVLIPGALITAQEFDDKVLFTEILVTSQKREQRLIDVPMSVTTLSGESIEQRGISNIQDLSFAVPGMTMRQFGPGSYIIFMRGIANLDASGALVGVYMDDSNLTVNGDDQLDMRPIDLERIEILKGPQGTLYGQGSIAGTVKYITRKPSMFAVEGSLGASYSPIADGDTKETITGVVNVPVVEDVFALRLAGRLEHGGGWQDQPEAGIKDGNNQDLVHLRLSADWNITNNFLASARIITHRNESELGTGYEEENRTVAVAIDPSIRLLPKEYDYDHYSISLSYDFSFAELLGISTYIEHDHQYPFTYFGTTETIFGGILEGNDDRFISLRQFTQEVRLVSTDDGSWQWTVGGFYQKLDREFFARFDTLFFGTVFPDAEFIEDTGSESFALFADVAYNFTEKLKVGVGVRDYSDNLSTWDGSLLERDGFDSTDPRFFALYKLSEQSSVYLNIAKGFRTGGFNQGVLPNYEPESIISYEIGTKAALFDNALSLEMAAYLVKYDDMLRRGLVFVSPAFVQLISNIGNVEVKGFEVGVNWHMAQDLLLSATSSWIDSEVTAIRSSDAVNIVGDQTDYVPKFSASLSAHYNFYWSEDMPGFARIDFNYRDKLSYIDRSSFPDQNLPQFSDYISLVDARIGLEWKQVRLELFGTNLANKNRYIDPFVAWKNANRTRPRTIGLQVTYDYDL